MGKARELELYREALTRIPPPGCGCHPALLSVANYGVRAGLDGQRITQDIRNYIQPGNRRVSDREIADAINKAMSDHNGVTFTPRPAPIVSNGKSVLKKIIDQAQISSEVDLWESSPIRLRCEPQESTGFFLGVLYKQEDLLFIGDQYQEGIIGDTIRTIAEWTSYFKAGGKTAPFIITNPLTGTLAPTKSGEKETLRGDNNIAAYRYCLVEFDDLSREEQIRFWSAVKLPICALIDSGGKSIHAWLDVQKLVKVETPEQWHSEIKVRLYEKILTPLGVDSACSNPARLSRLPGHYRQEKGTYQRLLWLSPEGRFIQ